MADPQDVALASTQGPAQSRGGAASQQSSPIWTVMRTLLWGYFMMQMWGKFFGSAPATSPVQPINSPVRVPEKSDTHLVASSSISLSSEPHTSQLFQYATYVNNWPATQIIDLHVFVSEEPHFTQFNSIETHVWTETGIVYNDWSKHLKKDVNVPVFDALRSNGSAYAHIYLTKTGVSPNSLDKSYQEDDVVYTRHMLNRYMPIRREVKKKNLVNFWNVSAENDDEGSKTVSSNTIDIEHNVPIEIISYWTGNLTINLVGETPNIAINIVPRRHNPSSHSLSEQKLQVEQSTLEGYGIYTPIVYMNEFWSLEHTFIPLVPYNKSITSLPLHLEYYPISLFKFQAYMAMDESMKQRKQSFDSSSAELDEIKRMLLETNPWFLALTMAVSILHSMFEFLAFKNDIQFWNKREDVHGISVRSILLNLFFQVVIFLYLFDNQQSTSWMILISNGIGLLIEFWKASKAVKVTIDTNGIIPRPRIENKKSYTESKTKQYDDEAFRYLSYVIYPCLVGYGIYSLLYDQHKGWYSFVLNTLVGYVYAFGFIMMTPQLFINYKLKSVAHLNGRTMIYKFLTTIVDDLFSFIIKMPTWHRIACFRDDIIFLIYVYQRWIYPVDKTRINEFGQGGESANDGAEIRTEIKSEKYAGIESEKKRLIPS